MSDTSTATCPIAMRLSWLASAAIAALLTAPAAFAQDSDKLETVVVTGSRIARTELDSRSPLTVVSEDFFKQKGTVNVEEVLNQLPQVVPGLGAQVNNGGDGTATVDLRGIGPTRTLVLINGRRFVPATNTGRTDLNAIPAQLIKRIDVVTGGASAVYGSDALAGVVNFVLKDDFSGVEVGGRYGLSAQSDAQTADFYAMAGGNFADDRGNATLAATWFDRADLFQDARAFSAIDKQGAGSATGIAGRIDNSPLNPFGAFAGNPASLNYAFNTDRTIRPFINALPEENGGVGDRYNFSPINYLVTPQTRYTLNGFTHYNITDSTQAYGELYYISNRSKANLAPTPATNLILPLNNPLLPQQVRNLAATRTVDPTAPLIFRRRMLEFGPRLSDQNFRTSQIVIGLRGDLTPRWKWDGYYSFGRTDSTVSIYGDISKERLNASLAGCPVGAGTIPGCRVVDFFGPGKLSAADATFLQIAVAPDSFLFDRHLLQANLSGSIVDLPAGPLGAAVGAEYRKDASNFIPSDSKQRGDFTGFNAQLPIKGDFDVKEVYGELNLPLVSGKPGVEFLGVGAALRYSDYSSVGGLVSFKGDMEYQPVQSLKFRSSYAKANRAPSVFELYQAGDQNSPTVSDPCALRLANGRAQVVPPAVQAICRLQGIAAGSYAAQTNTQVNSSRVGNSHLAEEKSTTLTFGLVWEPTFVEHLSATVDYYDIKIDGYIGRAYSGENSQVQACFASGVTTLAAYNADPACSLISRNASGELDIISPLVNASKLTTKGIDFAVNYGFALERLGLSETAGKITLRVDATHLADWTFDGNDFSGQTSTDNGTLPHWRGNVRAVYDRGPLQASINWNYIGTVDERPGDGGDTVVPGWSYVDLSAKYLFAEKYTVALGVTNVFDKGAPLIITGFTNTNTDNTTYDLIGRRYSLSFAAKF